MQAGKIADSVSIGNNVSIGENVVIKSGCVIEDNVIISDGVYVDYNVIIKENVLIGAGSFIGSNCILGEYLADFLEDRQNTAHPLVIGEKASIRSGTIIYGDTVIGNCFQTGHNVTIREKTKIGNHTNIGTLSDIQGYCKIGNYVRMHSNVHIGHKSEIEDFVWIFPYVVLTNDPTPPSNELKGVKLKSYAVVAAGSILLPGVIVEGDSLVAAGAIVTKDVHSGEVVGGNPAKVISDISNIRNHVTGESVYPWRYTFERGMPWQGIGYEKWREQASQNEFPSALLERIGK